MTLKGDAPAHKSGGGSHVGTATGRMFEQRTAAIFLTRLLTRGTFSELLPGQVQRLAFEGNSVDLIVTATGDDEVVIEHAIVTRRQLRFSSGNANRGNLVTELLAALSSPLEVGRQRHAAICVSGPQAAAQQVGELTGLARSCATASAFSELARRGPLSRSVVERLHHLVNLVEPNLEEADRTAVAGKTTWELLRRLDIVTLRLEPPDESHWDDLLTVLEPWASEPTVAAARMLRQSITSLAGSYAMAAADVDGPTLRRDLSHLVGAHVGSATAPPRLIAKRLRVVNEAMQDVVRVLARCPDFNGSVRERFEWLVQSVMLFLHSRMNAERGGAAGRYAYLFDPRALEMDLASDLKSWLEGNYPDAVLAEVHGIGGGRTDLTVQCDDFRLVVELKREQHDSSRASLARFLPQAAAYQSTDVALGMLVVLDLTSKRLAPANIRDNVWVEVVEGSELGDRDRFVVTVRVPGNRRSPSAL